MRDEWVRTIRTVIQVVSAVAVSIPLLLPALGVSTTIGAGASIVAVAAAVTRGMQIPAVASLLNKYFKVPMP